MAFKPKNASNNNNDTRTNDTSYNFPVPKSGPRKARVSLIVDLGVQTREDFEDPNTKELKPQKPCQQLAVFADLVNDVVDYGGDIGEAQYRLLLNKSFQGNIQGINFAATPPKDAKGNLLEGKPWGWHPANILTKLAKAMDKAGLITEMDAEQLLNGAFMADVEITEKKTDKKDANGDDIINKYVNLKGISKVPPAEDEEGNETPAVVAKLRQAAKCITFDNAEAEDIKFLRGGVIKMIKLATNYSGSQMQKAIEEFEGSKNDSSESTPAPTAPKKEVKKVAKKPVPADDMDNDVPF